MLKTCEIREVVSLRSAMSESSFIDTQVDKTKTWYSLTNRKIGMKL